MSHPNTPRRRVYSVTLNPLGYDPLNGDPFDEEGIEEVVVPVVHADQMVGEREAMKRGVTLDEAQNVTSVIVWCAMKRRGLFTGTYESFRDERCLDIANAARPGTDHQAEAEAEEGEEVPPTEGPSGSE